MGYTASVLRFVVLAARSTSWHSVRRLHLLERQLGLLHMDERLPLSGHGHGAVFGSIRRADIDLDFFHDSVANRQNLVHRQQRVGHLRVTLIVGNRVSFLLFVDIEGICLLHDSLLFLLILVIFRTTTVVTAHMQSALRILLLETTLINISY